MFRPNVVRDTDGSYRYKSGGRTLHDEALLATSDRLRGMYVMTALRAGQLVLQVPETGERYIPPPYSSGLNLRQTQNLSVAAHYFESHPENHFMMSSPTQDPGQGASSVARRPTGSRDTLHGTARYYSAPQPEAPMEDICYIQDQFGNQYPRQRRQRQRFATSSHRSHRRNAGPGPEVSQEPTSARVRHNSRDDCRAGPSTVLEQTKPKSSTPALTPLPLPTSNINSPSSQFQTAVLTPPSSSCPSPSPPSSSTMTTTSPFSLLLEIAAEMPTTEFLARLDNLHVQEAPAEKNNSLDRYREWMALSPATRMEIAGTSTDPRDCYGAIRVVGEWRWEERMGRAEMDLQGKDEGKEKGKGKEKVVEGKLEGIMKKDKNLPTAKEIERDLFESMRRLKAAPTLEELRRQHQCERERARPDHPFRYIQIDNWEIVLPKVAKAPLPQHGSGSGAGRGQALGMEEGGMEGDADADVEGDAEKGADGDGCRARRRSTSSSAWVPVL